jgi:hypothetical protein
MKSFKDFVKEDNGVVYAEPTHGGHSQMQMKEDDGVVYAEPTHGGHSQMQTKQKTFKFTKEETENKTRLSDWKNQHENNHLGDEEYQVHDRLNIPHEEWEKKPDSNSLVNFTYGSKEINKDLINRARGSIGDKWNDNQIASMDRHLSKTSFPYSHLYVYHGTTSWNPAEKLKEVKDNTLRMPTYISTSISKKIAAGVAATNNIGNGRHIIRIKVKKGQKGEYLGDNSNPAHIREKEFLMPRDQKLRFDSTPKIVHDEKGPIHIWNAEAIQDQEHHNG